jgi:hypothetical protein
VASLLAACGGDSDAQPAADAQLEAAATSEATAGPTATPVLQLHRFQYTATLTLREERLEGEAMEVIVSTDGSFQGPDRHAFTYTTKLANGQVAESAVLIGADAWLRTNDEPWRKTARDDAEVTRVLSTAFSAVRPSFLGGDGFAEMRESVQRLTPTEDDANGIPADHYVVSAEGRRFFQDFLADPTATGQDISWELWLAREGAWPVRLLVSGRLQTDTGILEKLGLAAPATWELRIEISRPNDPALTVQAPQ